MPGIFGIISQKNKEKNTNDLNLMQQSMMHESFYTWSSYINDELGIYLGWIGHKGSFSDCMPVKNEKNDLLLFFSGENFADKDPSNQLKRRGHQFDPSNANYLIHLYEEDRNGFFEQLNGWFCGIILDLRKEKAILFNDRYGMKRIYYNESKDAFIFSSEAKALLKIRPEIRRIDLQGLGEFFICDCVLENRTLFSNVFLLPGGSIWTFSKSRSVKKNCYFKQNEWENQPILEKQKFYNRLRETFLNILPRYFITKESIAMSLTSGLDTRSIMSNLNHNINVLHCYTFSGMLRETFDASIARKIANACDKEHQVLQLGDRFFSDFPKFAEKTVYFTDGCHDVCGSHDIYFNQIARNIAPVRMTGKFGSEIIGNMSMLRKSVKYSDNFFHPDFKKYISNAARAFKDIKKGHELSFAVFKEMPWHEYGRLAMEMAELTIRTPYMDNDLVRLMYQAPKNARASSEIRLRLIKDGNRKLRRIMTDRGDAGEFNWLFSMSAKLVCRCLFKSEYVYLYQIPHWLSKLDFAFKSLQPERLILGRYQYVHPRVWFRDKLSNYVRDILLDSRTAKRQFFNRKFLEEMITGHIEGKRNYVNEINKALTVELIHRLLIEDI